MGPILMAREATARKEQTQGYWGAFVDSSTRADNCANNPTSKPWERGKALGGEKKGTSVVRYPLCVCVCVKKSLQPRIRD